MEWRALADRCESPIQSEEDLARIAGGFKEGTCTYFGEPPDWGHGGR